MRPIVTALLSALLMISAVAHADAGAGNVANFTIDPDDHSVLFEQSGSRSNVPGCGANLPTRWAFDPTTPIGQSMMATVLTAEALHKQVTISGSGDCSVHYDTETAHYLTMLG